MQHSGKTRGHGSRSSAGRGCHAVHGPPLNKLATPRLLIISSRLKTGPSGRTASRRISLTSRTLRIGLFCCRFLARNAGESEANLEPDRAGVFIPSIETCFVRDAPTGAQLTGRAGNFSPHNRKLFWQFPSRN
jgi:hypothetical protein